MASGAGKQRLSVGHSEGTASVADGAGAAGVYFLANDQILPWAKSFVRSFRAHNPDLPLCLIPFDDHSAKTRELVRHAGGTVLEMPEDFARLERIGASLELGHTTSGRFWFRRYAAFAGIYDSFLYLDARIVVLADLTFFTLAPQHYEMDLVYYDTAIEQVYNPGPIRQGFVRAGRGRGFLSGMWASRRELFTLEQMEAAGRQLCEVRQEMNARNTDQFFINYLCDSNQVKTAHVADLHGGFAHSTWARNCPEVYRDAAGAWRIWDFGRLQHGSCLPFMHWAGIALGPSMPHFGLFQSFQRPLGSRLLSAWSMACGLPGHALNAVRSRRFFNQLYHRFRVWQRRFLSKDKTRGDPTIDGSS